MEGNICNTTLIPLQENLLNATTEMHHGTEMHLSLRASQKFQPQAYSLISWYKLEYHVQILSRFSETAFILGRTSGSPSVHDIAT